MTRGGNARDTQLMGNQSDACGTEAPGGRASCLGAPTQAFQAQFEMMRPGRCGRRSAGRRPGLRSARRPAAPRGVRGLRRDRPASSSRILDALHQERDALAGHALPGPELGAQQRRRVDGIRAQHAAPSQTAPAHRALRRARRCRGRARVRQKRSSVDQVRTLLQPCLASRADNYPLRGTSLWEQPWLQMGSVGSFQLAAFVASVNSGFGPLPAAGCDRPRSIAAAHRHRRRIGSGGLDRSVQFEQQAAPAVVANQALHPEERS